MTLLRCSTTADLPTACPPLGHTATQNWYAQGGGDGEHEAHRSHGDFDEFGGEGEGPSEVPLLCIVSMKEYRRP